MSIIRAPRPNQSFTIIRNDVLHDERLSYRARGILVTILSRHDDWRTDAAGLQRGGTEGREAIRSALTELEQVGYLVRQRSQDERGRWRQVALVYDVPVRPAAGSETQMELAAIHDGNPTTGNPSPVANHDGNPTPGNPAAGSLGAITRTETKDYSVPTERAKAAEDVIAKAVYDGTQGMIKYLGIRQIAGRALKTGATPEAVQAAMLALYADGRPITLQTVGQRLNGAQPSGGMIQPQDDHYRQGGEFFA